MSGVGGPSGGHPGSGYGGRGGPPSGRSFEDRSVAREQMMQTVRDSSQQDRRVYVGNLSYDVKWHHLKDFMRQGEHHCPMFVLEIIANYAHFQWYIAGEVLFADVLLLPNGMSKVGANV
jgi:RNA recognition motif-containing protein